jgi:hypothetical protein
MEKKGNGRERFVDVLSFVREKRLKINLTARECRRIPKENQQMAPFSSD